MKENDSILVSLSKELNVHFYCYFKNNKMLAISEDKASLPFAIIVKERSKYLISLALDYPVTFNVAKICLVAPNHCGLNLAESFYISPKSGHTFFGDEAGNQWDLDTLDISLVEPISQSLN